MEFRRVLFRSEIVRALTLGGVAGHQQHRQRREVLGNLEREADAVEARHDDVGDQQIEDVAVERLQCLHTVLHRGDPMARSEEHTSELQSLMRISYAVISLKKNKNNTTEITRNIIT